MPYLYLGNIGTVSGSQGLDYSDITPMPEGTTVGIIDSLDICCWHDDFTEYPEFLKVLATYRETGNAVALGGSRVFIGEPTTTGRRPRAEDHRADDHRADDHRADDHDADDHHRDDGHHGAQSGAGDDDLDQHHDRPAHDDDHAAPGDDAAADADDAAKRLAGHDSDRLSHSGSAVDDGLRFRQSPSHGKSHRVRAFYGRGPARFAREQEG